MAGFVRRYNYFPGVETITQIEGVIIVDLPPPGQVQGVGSGTIGFVGEFADMAYATTVNTTGVISSKIVPVEIFSGQDLIEKVGGWDETLGQWGGSLGNGYAALKNKRFSRLVVAPVNLASAQGSRYGRDLPLSTSQADTTPVVPVSAGTIAAGREFRSGVGRLKVGRRVDFTGRLPIKTGVGGSIDGGASAATQTFNMGESALAAWQVDASPGPDVFVDQTAAFNSPTNADVTPFPGTEAVTDYFAIGFSAPFQRVIFNTLGGTQGVGGVVVWEYWNGSAWAALSGVSDGTAGFTAALADGQILSYTLPADWAQNTLNSVAAYYIRARITTIYGTNPVFSQGFIAREVWAEISRGDGTLGAREGDILVVGYNNAGAKAPSGEAGTYRVVATPAAGTVVLSVERLDGANFTWTLQSNVPYRLHFGTDADSAPERIIGAVTPGGYSIADAGGYVVPIRPITDSTGAQADGTFPTATVLAPAVAPTATTGDTWDPLSGLFGRTHPSAATQFTAAVQGVNPAASSSIDALYVTALNALNAESDPVRDVNIVLCARKSANIRSALKTHVLVTSGIGRGRMALIAPPLTTVSLSTVLGAADPGVGAQRDERVVYSWPGARHFVQEAVGFLLNTADGLATSDGILDDTLDHWMMSVLSVLAPERNPGQGAPPATTALAPILDFQRAAPALGIEEYIALRAQGVAALRRDRTVGPIFQSGITTSLTSGQKNIARRRMADFIEDSLAERLVAFSKLPLTQQLKDDSVGEAVAFMEELLSANNPAAQRIADYSVDDKSGNTPALEAQGIFVIIVKGRTLATNDFFTIQAEIGEGVVVTSSL